MNAVHWIFSDEQHFYVMETKKTPGPRNGNRTDKDIGAQKLNNFCPRTPPSRLLLQGRHQIC